MAKEETKENTERFSGYQRKRYNNMSITYDLAKVNELAKLPVCLYPVAPIGLYTTTVTFAEFVNNTQAEPYFALELAVTEPACHSRRQFRSNVLFGRSWHMLGGFLTDMAILGLGRDFWVKLGVTDPEAIAPQAIAREVCRAVIGRPARVWVTIAEDRGDLVNKVRLDSIPGVSLLVPSLVSCKVNHCYQERLQEDAFQYAIPLYDGKLEEDELPGAADAFVEAGWLRAEDLPITTVEQLLERLHTARRRHYAPAPCDYY